jgi:parallel beta-helix repeat protein
MRISDRIGRINAVTPATQSENSSSGRSSAWKSLRCSAKKVAFKLPSRFVGQAYLLSFFLVAAASVLLALRLQSGYAENTREQVALDTKTLDKGGQVPVNVKAYGAVGDGVTNDTAAFKAAFASLITAGGGVCLVPKGTYIISASGFTAPYVPAVSSRVHLVGVGRGASILKVNGMPTNHLLQCDGDNWSVENLTFDMGDYTPSAVLSAITCKGNNWRVANCAVIKIGRYGIAAFGGSNWSIEGNYVTRTVAPGTVGAILVAANKGVWSSNARVVDNVCEGAGICFSGDYGIIARNRVSRSGGGTGIFVQGSPSTHSPNITGNICTGGSSGHDASQGGKWWSVSGFEIWAPDSVISHNTAHDNDGGGFAIGGQNSVVIGNKAYNNGRGGAGHAGFVARINPARGATASHSVFIGNSACDTRYPSTDATQDYGYMEQPGGLIDIKHFGNNYNHNRIGPTKYSSAGGQRNVSEAQNNATIPMRISSEMKNKLKALAGDREMSDIARRAIREYLDREEKAPLLNDER